MEDNTSFRFDLIDVLKLIFKFKWLFVIVALVVGTLTYIFSGPSFITPKFKGTAIMYPTANSSFSQSILEPNFVFQKKPMDYGDKEEGEQLTQILKSETLLMKVIRQFKLYEHYGFDTTKYWSPTILKLMLKKNVKIDRTDYMAIQIDVLDKDPQFAKDMANYFCEAADQLKSDLYKQKSEKAYIISKREFEEKSDYLDSLNQLLTNLRSQGIFEYKTQVLELYGQLISAQSLLVSEKAKLKVYENNKSAIPDSTIVKTMARIKGAESTIASVSPALKTLGKFGGKYNDISEKLNFEQERFAKIKQAYEQAKIDFLTETPQKYVVSYAEVPDIPSEPRRYLIAFIATLSAVFIAFLSAVFIEQVLPRLQSRA